MAEKANAFKLKEKVPQIDNLLFKAEKLAIFLVIILPSFRCFSFIYFILTSFLCTDLPLQRRLGTPSSTPNYYHLFLLWRAASIVLVLYFSGTNWYTAENFLMISATCNGCIFVFMLWQRLQSPNPRKLTFLLERLAAIVFILYPGSARISAEIFWFSSIIYLICLALRLNVNPRPNEPDYLFWIERVVTIILKFHCTNRTIFIARIVLVVTNSVYIADHTVEPKQGQQMQGFSNPVSRIETPRISETNQVEQLEKEKAKTEDDPPEEMLGIDQEELKEENNKWKEDDLVEADDQLKEKLEVEEEASKEENNKWEWEVLEVDDCWEEELVETDNVNEIENDVKAIAAEGIEEVERLKAENENLKREKELLWLRLGRKREEYEQDYQNMLKKMQEEFEETLMLERQVSRKGGHSGCATPTK